MQGFFRRDVVFLHPPARYDFRKDTALLGPVSDVVPSSPAFEMYPVGVTSIADCLERAGYHVQIINVAYRMLTNPRYDPEADIRRHRPRLWAIDLHCCPMRRGRWSWPGWCASTIPVCRFCWAAFRPRTTTKS